MLRTWAFHRPDGSAPLLALVGLDPSLAEGESELGTGKFFFFFFSLAPEMLALSGSSQTTFLSDEY